MPTTDRSERSSSGGILTRDVREPLSESILWRHVIRRAIVDIIHPVGRRADQNKREAIQWIRSEDFHTVCELADIDPGVMYPRMINLLKLEGVYRVAEGRKMCRALVGIRGAAMENWGAESEDDL